MGCLFSLCRLNDGVHWLIISANGAILECSPYGFADEAEALIDLRYRI